MWVTANSMRLVLFLIYDRGYRQTALEKLTFRESFGDFETLPGLIETEAFR